jgi:alpha-ketoglutarate-dependent taurine dioxygenase
VILDTQALRDFVCRFSGKDLFDYAGGASPRHQAGARRIYNSTDYPPEISIQLHNELSYSSIYPQHLFFICIKPADAGGQTTLGDGRRILEAIDRDVVEELRRRGVCYIRNLSREPGSGYSWPEAFDTDDERAVEAICGKSGAEFRWTDDGAMQIRQFRPATITHPVTGEEVWFNQAAGFYFDRSKSDAATRPRLESTFGDGGPIPAEMIDHIGGVLEAQAVAHDWETGDIVILDNVLAEHGRMPFTGTREIVLAMT